MPIVPIRADNAYMGWAKQASQGTPLAPTNFVRWMDGSNIQIDLKAEDVWEGDSSRRLSQIVKNQQVTKFKVVKTPRPIELGMTETAGMGINADTITTTTPSTTSNTTVTGGTSTTIGLVSGTGFAATGQSGTFVIMVGTGTATDPFEAVTFTAPVSGTTLTVAAGYNGGKFISNHPSGTTVASVAAVNTSITSTLTAGGTTIVVGNQIGISGTPTVVLSPGLTTEEIVVVNASSVTGTGPWTYTLNASATLKNGHAIGDTVLAPISHVITDQSDGNYYTWEISLGGTSGLILRITDCKMETLKVSGKAGSLLMVEEDWVGITSVVRTTASTVTLENHQVFLYTQGVWTLNGSLTGDALAVEQFDITRKNNLDIGIQAEQLILAAIIFGNLDVDVAVDVIFQNSALIGQTYFGTAAGSTPIQGATDAQAIINGSLTLKFTQADNFHTAQYLMNTLQFSKVGFPVMKKDGKHFKQSLSAASTSNMATNTYLLQTTVQNAQTTVY